MPIMPKKHEPDKTKPQYISSTDKRGFDRQVALLLGKGWTIESKRKKDGLHSAKLVFKK
jgi:hypothetical protein